MLVVQSLYIDVFLMYFVWITTDKCDDIFFSDHAQPVVQVEKWITFRWFVGILGDIKMWGQWQTC